MVILGTQRRPSQESPEKCGLSLAGKATATIWPMHSLIKVCLLFEPTGVRGMIQGSPPIHRWKVEIPGFMAASAMPEVMGLWSGQPPLPGPQGPCGFR